MFRLFALAGICSMDRANPLLFENERKCSEHDDFIRDRTAIVSTIFDANFIWNENPSKILLEIGSKIRPLVRVCSIIYLER